MKNKKISVGELIAYIVFALIALSGLVLVILHVISMNIANLNNDLRQANEAFAATMKMSWLVFGSLLVVLAGVLSAIVLAVNGQKAEVIAEKKARRQQRLSLENDDANLE